MAEIQCIIRCTDFNAFTDFSFDFGAQIRKESLLSLSEQEKCLSILKGAISNVKESKSITEILNTSVAIIRIINSCPRAESITYTAPLLEICDLMFELIGSVDPKWIVFCHFVFVNLNGIAAEQSITNDNVISSKLLLIRAGKICRQHCDIQYQYMNLLQMLAMHLPGWIEKVEPSWAEHLDLQIFLSLSKFTQLEEHIVRQFGSDLLSDSSSSDQIYIVREHLKLYLSHRALDLGLSELAQLLVTSVIVSNSTSSPYTSILANLALEQIRLSKFLEGDGLSERNISSISESMEKICRYLDGAKQHDFMDLITYSGVELWNTILPNMKTDRRQELQRLFRGICSVLKVDNQSANLTSKYHSELSKCYESLNLLTLSSKHNALAIKYAEVGPESDELRLMKIRLQTVVTKSAGKRF